MSKIAQADFYFGAALSILFNKKMIPALIENGDKRRIYKVVTDNNEFVIYMKYRSTPTTDGAEYFSWQFIFSDSDIDGLNEYLEQNLIVLLICGKEQLNKSEIALLEVEDIRKCLIEVKKGSLTIGRKKYEKAYRISLGGGRGSSLQIKANALNKLR